MKNTIKIPVLLFFIWFLWILTLLTVTIPFDPSQEILDTVSPQNLKYLILIDPTILLILAVIIGSLLYKKVNLWVYTLSWLLNIEKSKISFLEQMKFGIPVWIFAGIFIITSLSIFSSFSPQEFSEVWDQIVVSILARIGYGWFTEEILMRFGFMTLIIWLIFKVTKKLNNYTYWGWIILASMLFAFWHFPAAFNILEMPSLILLAHIFIGNMIPGILFGWLYWKKWLEAAFIWHITTHIIMLVLEQL